MYTYICVFIYHIYIYISLSLSLINIHIHHHWLRHCVSRDATASCGSWPWSLQHWLKMRSSWWLLQVLNTDYIGLPWCIYSFHSHGPFQGSKQTHANAVEQTLASLCCLSIVAAAAACAHLRFKVASQSLRFQRLWKVCQRMARAVLAVHDGGSGSWKLTLSLF